MKLQFLGAAGEVTGSCYLIQLGKVKILLECGLFQGTLQDEARNRQPFPFDPATIDAVILSHAHIDHSGRIPLLVKSGFSGPIYTHKATFDLCRILLRDSAYLSEKDAEWENRKRERKGLPLVEALYTVQDAERAQQQFRPLAYQQQQTLLPGVKLRFADAGHILGSAIVELWLEQAGKKCKLVFSGDLGRSGMPVLEDPEVIKEADLVLLESTYGDRLHRSWEDTRKEVAEVFADAIATSKGNILLPAFAVGRTQEILYLFAKYYEEWQLSRWQIFLDSPLAIEATEVYAANSDLFDDESLRLWRESQRLQALPNLHFTRHAEESMKINNIRGGAIIIAGSGMCNGGRIKHHLKHNVWRRECHILMTGFQARGTLGRALVDGASHIRLWGETIRVAASVHTIGGMSAHADQAGLIKWYQNFSHRPPLVLVHGETEASSQLAKKLVPLASSVKIARLTETLELGSFTS